ncbi:hypothetical protein like AT4G29090 [Hibiscus trionum]|uniref:RNase H type-1 domain-containing protein n=1 Tax=Hibiscus trionum TaxID=183268 RepID=A0A9W7M3V6_HIBTR|nr:hypothetical protein like AT4G29090 [Hibiscus trionum]
MNSIYIKDSPSSLLEAYYFLHVGDGKSILFWSDKWVGDSPLKIKFPRIYALATNKTGKIEDFGTKQGSSWSWNIPLRRAPFDWELEQWNACMDCLNAFKQENFDRDCFTWKATGDGIYTARSCYKILNQQPESIFPWVKVVWSGLAPPRVEFFLWQATLNKIPVRALLIHKGMSHDFDTKCPFCLSSAETTSHLFLHCKFTWSLWIYLFSFWKIHVVMPADITALLFIWTELLPWASSNVLWPYLPPAVIWTIWLMRNETVFQKKPPDLCNLKFLARFRLVSWFKANNPDCKLSFDDIMADPSRVCSPCTRTKIKTGVCKWQPPPMGFLKLNVDGAVSRDGKSGGIGGLLRNYQGSKFLVFSESINPGTVVLGELMAIKVGISRLSSVEETKKNRIIIESDSALAIAWINSTSQCPSLYKVIVDEIKEQGSLSNYIFRFAPRICNIEADSLAKEGIG